MADRTYVRSAHTIKPMTVDTTSSPTNKTTLLAGLMLLVCLVAAGVALALAGWQPETIVGLLSGIGGVAAVMLPLLDRLTNVQRETRQQTQALAVITDQTNGALRTKIRTEIRAAIPEIVDGVRAAWDAPVPYALDAPVYPGAPVESPA